MIELNELCIPAIPSKLTFIKKGSDYLIVHPDKPVWTIVNKTGFEIIKLCNGRRSLHDIGLIISSRNKILLPTVLNDLIKFLKEFTKTGFFSINSEPAGKRVKKSKPAVSSDSETLSDKPGNKQNFTIDRLFLHVTSKCNYKCRHCYFPDGSVNGRELSREEIYSIIDRFISQGGKSIVLSGGEPLLRKDIINIIKYAFLKLQISLLTNGSMIDRELIDLLKNKNISIQISLDGSCAAVNDSIRGDGCFRKAMEAIKLIKDNGLIDRLTICSTIMDQNINDLPNIIKLAEKLDISQLRFLPLRKEGRGRENWNEINGRVTKKDYISFYKYVYGLIVNKEVRVPIQSGLGGVAVTFSSDDLKKGMWCNVGRELTISSNGNVYPCPLLMKDEFLLGNVRKINLDDIKASEKFKDIHKLCLERQELIIKCKRCMWKNFCRAGCAGMALADKNKIMDVDAFCEFRKKLYEDIIFSLAQNKRGSTKTGQQNISNGCF